MRPEELVGRAGEEVRAERSHVDADMCRVVDAVNVDECADLMRRRSDRGNIRHRSEQVRRRGYRDEPGPVTQLGYDVRNGKLSRLLVERNPAHDGANGVRGDHPGPDVRVVVETRHDDLLARRPRL